MTVDYIRYDILTQDALRSVVHTVLTDAAAKGLPGEHHFFISFDTRAEGVSLSSRLKAQYPKEMTIVLQHQFWDLVVTEDRFEVGLSFSGIPERLVVPFRAITGFADPSVQFGLQFSVTVDEDEAADAAPAATGGSRPSAGQDQPPQSAPPPANPAPLAAKTATRPAAAAGARNGTKAGGTKSGGTKAESTKAESTKPSGTEADAATSKQPPTGGEVVRLDRFRKK